MQRKTLVKLLSILFLATTFTMSAKDPSKDAASSGDSRAERKQQVKDYIAHHLLDSHDFGLFSYTDDATKQKHHVGFPLPIILWDSGLKVFSSSKFHHGESVAQVDGNYYKIEHAKIYKTDAAGTITYDTANHPTNLAPLDFSITKGVFMILITAFLMFFVALSLSKCVRILVLRLAQHKRK